MKEKNQKIAVAMSGGVDSSVSARLLKEKGYNLAGFYMDFGCGSSLPAEKVAKKLKIPFKKISGRKLFQKEVIDYFINEYKNLRTPNPCVVCNKIIKFGWLLEMANKDRCDKLATGHYVRAKKDRNGIFHLMAGKDKNKDQSYFLYRLNQAQLSWVIFPLGEMSKDDVKKISKKNKLPNNKNESQEVCFLTDDNYRNFLKRHLPKKYFQSGVIVDKNGKKIGRHGGLINYTIGQRKGINQTGFRDDNKQPLYVIGFNAEKNELIVGQDKDLLKKEVIVENISWVSDWAKKKALANKNLKARIRYRHNPANCKLRLSGGKLKISFSISQRAIVPGQSLVIYCGQEVLGGGIIVK